MELPSDITPAHFMGGLFIEICIAILLYGIIIAQIYFYWLNSRGDSVMLRAVVWAVCSFEALHTIFIVHMAYSYAVEGFGNFEKVSHIVWSAGASVLMEMLIISLTQGFYLWRIWILSSKSLLLTVTTGFFIFIRVGFGLVSGGLTYSAKTWAVYRDSFGPFFTVTLGLALSVVVDFLITATLMFYLYRCRTGFDRTDGVVKWLMAYAVHTGAISMILSIATLLTYVLVNHSLVYAGLVTMSSKLYANSFLGTLNARQLHRQKIQKPGTSDSNRDRSIYISRTSEQPHIEIFRETTKVTVLDHDGTPRSPAPLKFYNMNV
ncbi:unnamed protein product [Somion occarium]|uniref:DUF6534 domain-containing protein n=1 Tax=Somion occarium TaxID=3059160 RepID=A0ABP1DSG3_9APHY